MNNMKESEVIIKQRQLNNMFDKIEEMENDKIKYLFLGVIIGEIVATLVALSWFIHSGFLKM